MLHNASKMLTKTINRSQTSGLHDRTNNGPHVYEKKFCWLSKDKPINPEVTSMQKTQLIKYLHTCITYRRVLIRRVHVYTVEVNSLCRFTLHYSVNNLYFFINNIYLFNLFVVHQCRLPLLYTFSMRLEVLLAHMTLLLLNHMIDHMIQQVHYPEQMTQTYTEILNATLIRK